MRIVTGERLDWRRRRGTSAAVQQDSRTVYARRTTHDVGGLRIARGRTDVSYEGDAHAARCMLYVPCVYACRNRKVMQARSRPDPAFDVRIPWFVRMMVRISGLGSRGVRPARW